MRGVLLVVLVLALFACSTNKPNPPSFNHLVFLLNDSTHATFPVTILDTAWIIHNGGEDIQLDLLTNTTLKVPVFNGTLTLESEARGHWTDSLRPRSSDGSYRVSFKLAELPLTGAFTPIAGSWDVWFGDQIAPKNDSPDAQLDLRSFENKVYGTMRTPTGDYRYLSGSFDGTDLTLQTFDGAHLFFFDATYDGVRWINGHFYSGVHYHTSWSTRPATPRQTNVALNELNPRKDSLLVRFIEPGGRLSQRSLVPEKGCVTVVDILGTWCPNCMDEVRLLNTLSSAKIDRLSVAFERPESTADAYARLNAFRSEMGVGWEIVLGGRANKKDAADAFPFLDNVVSFPTTLFIQNDGTVHVHSGFNGPATGLQYQAEIDAFQQYATPSISMENR